ncbi:ATP-binding cassette domain-containing protein [Oceanobacillus jeddahense]|uniref:ATP-binding cassette domain-containing protein n=1 Tax=Oceanobacillus jeddahense TaxID=1462527 RepID=UPI003631BDFA
MNNMIDPENKGVDGLTCTTDEDLAIKVRALTKKYGKDVFALNGLNFSVQKGEIYGFLGPNGAGKSTAVKVMTTLSRPSQGEVQLYNVDAIHYPEEARKLFGYVAQQSAVDGESTGRENLMLQGRLYGLRGSILSERVVQLLERFDLMDAADRLSKTYSGGMQRKLDLAMGLIHHPKILFLDEPTTGLDPEARASLWDTIHHLSKEDGLTVLLTTHYLEEADQLCDRLAIIDKGKVIVQGTPEALKGEMHGDVVHIETMEAISEFQAKDMLQGISDLHEIIVDGLSVYVRTNQGAEQLPALMSILKAENIKVRAATISRPSLDDVYLRYTGHVFAETEEREVSR